MYLKQNVFFSEYSVDCYIQLDDYYIDFNYVINTLYCYKYTLDFDISTKKPIGIGYVFKTE